MSLGSLGEADRPGGGSVIPTSLVRSVSFTEV